MRPVNTSTIAGTIAEGGASQEVAPRNPRRDLLVIKNPSSQNEPLFYAFGAAADIDDGCPSLEPGESLALEAVVPSEAIHLTAETAGHRFVVLVGQRGGIE